MNNQPLIVITGPTASGKSALAMKLALEFRGEIICADSRTIYEGLDIGTAKPSHDDRQLVPHHLLDVVKPDDAYSVADFQRQAKRAIGEIRSRGNTPFLVGGTGLYIDSVLYDFSFSHQVDPEERHRLDKLTIEELQQECKKRNISLPENHKNKRHLVRWLEKNGALKQIDNIILSNTFVVAIATNKEILRQRIVDRTEHFLEQGVIEEAIKQSDLYGWKNNAMTGNIYPLIEQFLEQKLTKSELKEKFTTLDWRLAKRQTTWIRRHPEIPWFNLQEAEKHLRHALEVET